MFYQHFQIGFDRTGDFGPFLVYFVLILIGLIYIFGIIRLRVPWNIAISLPQSFGSLLKVLKIRLSILVAD